jgi:RNA polymerase sigma factor (TIGR02999 family)
MTDVTQILSQMEQGDPSAADQLLPIVYDELRKLAAHKLASENPGQTLQATSLVHEAYLRLVGNDNTSVWDSRGHFFAAAAEAMRRILIDAARRKRSLRRGGNSQRHELDECDPISLPVDDQLLDLDAALIKLTDLDAHLAELVKIRFFAGLTIDEAAAALHISPRTAKRNWAYARAWLRRELDDADRL